MKLNFKSTLQQIILASIIAIILLLISCLYSVNQGKNDDFSIANNGSNSDIIEDSDSFDNFLRDDLPCADCGYNYKSYGLPFNFLSTYEGGFSGRGGFSIEPIVFIDFIIYFVIVFIIIRNILRLRKSKRNIAVKR